MLTRALCLGAAAALAGVFCLVRGAAAAPGQCPDPSVEVIWGETVRTCVGVPGAPGETGPAPGRPAPVSSQPPFCHMGGTVPADPLPGCWSPTTPAPSRTVTPATLAVHVVNLLPLPRPSPEIRPLLRFADGTTGGLTGAPLWLWQRSWPTLRQRTEAGGMWAEVTAEPLTQTWYFGDGSDPVVCLGPGTPLTDPERGLDGSPDCGYRYRVSSRDQPGGRYTLRVVVTWQVTWTGSGNTGGVLAPLELSHSQPYPVRQARAQLVDPGP